MFCDGNDVKCSCKQNNCLVDQKVNIKDRILLAHCVYVFCMILIITSVNNITRPGVVMVENVFCEVGNVFLAFFSRPVRIKICDGQSGTGAGVCLSCFFPASAIPLMLHSHLCLFVTTVRRTSGRNVATFRVVILSYISQ